MRIVTVVVVGEFGGGANAGREAAVQSLMPRKRFAAIPQSCSKRPRIGSAAQYGGRLVADETSTKSNGTAKKAGAGRAGDKPVLLAGGNPQIAKADGDAPVQAYIAAMPGWKSEVGRHLDDLIERTVPDVRKAVRWNSPFYGIEGQGWFASTHVFTRYVKVTFFNGASLEPVPPGSGKDPDGRWIDLHEGEFDAAQMETWIRQSAALPGWQGF